LRLPYRNERALVKSSVGLRLGLGAAKDHLQRARPSKDSADIRKSLEAAIRRSQDLSARQRSYAIDNLLTYCSNAPPEEVAAVLERMTSDEHPTVAFEAAFALGTLARRHPAIKERLYISA
jgi:hypothetical protein